MNLPEFDRVIYERNPLVAVVCQLRFPPILKISHQKPVEFQDNIRDRYPLFTTRAPQIPSEILKLVQQSDVSLPFDNIHSFLSEDQSWELSITQNFISLKTSSYERYEEFKQRFEEVLDIFEMIYKPSSYIRAGIQYQDIIIRSRLDLEDTDWSELIAQHIASELHSSEFSADIQGINKRLLLKMEHGHINLNHGIVTVQEPEEIHGEEAYLFDADFYSEKKIEGKRDAWILLDQFNKIAGRLFRSSISRVLHDAMRPRAVDLE